AERPPAVLELLGHRHDEPHVVARQLLLGGHIALERLPRELHLLLAVEEGDPADLVEIEGQTLTAFINCTSDLRRSHRATLATCLNSHAVRLLQDSRPPHS